MNKPHEHLQVGSLYVYPHRKIFGHHQSAADVRRDFFRFQRSSQNQIQRLVRDLKREITQPKSSIASIFNPAPILIPTPTSSPRYKDQKTVNVLVCEALVNEGLGSSVHELVIRQSQIAKVPPDSEQSERPSLEDHLLSLDVREPAPELLFESKAVLVDDLVTQGTTLLAVKSCLDHLGITWRVQAFAAYRSAMTNAEGYGELNAKLENIRPSESSGAHGKREVK